MSFKKIGVLLPLALVASLLVLAACGTEEAPAASVQPTAAPAAPAPAVQPTAAPAQPAPAAVSQPATAPAEPQMGAALIGELEGPTIIDDEGMWPTSFSEAPQLAELVAAGTLPPVAERIGEDPLVIKPVHEIGQ